MRVIVALGAIALAGLVAAAGCTGKDTASQGSNGQAVELAIACGALGVERQLCQRAVDEWSADTGIPVRVVTTPNSSTDRLALYLQMLASRTATIDVLQIDVVWTGLLASHLADLGPLIGDAADAHFPALIENDTIDGRLVALPWWTDVGVLYYRKDLLERYGYAPPRTWQELTRIASDVQEAERDAGNARLWGYVFQGRAYEGLTCNALEWIAAFGGGHIVDESGAVTIANERAERALELAGTWPGRISPRGVLNYDEEAARGVFQTGRAVFMRNWPYAWALAQGEDSPVRDKVGVIELPSGEGPDASHAGTLGGWHLAVSRYSKHPRAAADLVRYLTSEREQKRRAIEASYNPTIERLYGDAEVLAANPFFAELYPSLQAAVARPARIAGPHYNRLSADVWRAAHDVLEGADAGETLARLQDELERLRYRAEW